MELHEFDKRLSSVEEWREQVSSIDLPSIREAIKNEIPAHYTKRIGESESKIMLQLGNLIDEKLDKRFGWMPRGVETIVTSAIVALILYGLGML